MEAAVSPHCSCVTHLCISEDHSSELTALGNLFDALVLRILLLTFSMWNHCLGWDCVVRKEGLISSCHRVIGRSFSHVFYIHQLLHIFLHVMSSLLQVNSTALTHAVRLSRSTPYIQPDLYKDPMMNHKFFFVWRWKL